MLKLFIFALLIQIGGSGGVGGTAGVGRTTPVITIARVNAGSTGNQTIASELTTTSTGSTTTAGNFFRVVVSVKSGTILTVTANPGSLAMTQAANFVGARSTVGVWYLPNIASGVNSVTVAYSSSNGSIATIDSAEYSGMSTSATVVNTFVTCSSAFITTAFTCGPYTATATNLLVGACAANQDSAGATWTSGSGWTTTNTWTTPGTDTTAWSMEQLAPSAGSYSTSGTLSSGATLGQFYDCVIGSFK
jgi:hypothetical protein